MPQPIPGLRPDLPVGKAAGLTLQTRAGEMAATLGRALDPDDAEGIHDLRVATRRLRAAIDAYAKCFPKKGLKALRREVRDLFRTTGLARDLEVQLGRLRGLATDAPAAARAGLDGFIDHLQDRYDEELDRVRKAVGAFEESRVAERFAWFVWGATGVAPL